MIKKLEKLEHPTVYYADIAYSTGLSINTIKAWFNYTQGVKIPTKYVDNCNTLLDRRLKIDNIAKELEKKYPILKM